MAKSTDVTAALESEVVFDSNVVGKTDGDAINRAMNKAIAEATTVDDILSANASAVEKLKPLWEAGIDWVRNPLTILSVDFNESSEEYSDSGWGFYAVMQVEDSVGVMHTLSCGGKTVTLKLYQLDKNGHFPMTKQVVFTGTRTKNGFTVFDLEAA